MKKKELEKLADSFQAKADTAYRNYQETGISRYGSTARRHEKMADAIRMAAEAADEHYAYINLKLEMSNLASRAEKAKSSSDKKERIELMEALVRDMIACGRLYGLIG